MESNLEHENPDLEKIEPDLWEDGENTVTRLLRAAFTLLCGGFLAWAQMKAPIDTGTQWNQWIWLSVVANFLLPAFVIWMFFAQGFTHLEWLREQRLNAWNYGWNFRDWKHHCKLAGIMFLLMLPFLFFAARDETTRAFYHHYLPPVHDLSSWLWLIFTLTIYMACWEWFHRGFLLFGMAQGFGPYLAVVVQAALFAATHLGKPQLEVGGAFAGGLVLGIIAWREKSFAPAFYTHTLIHIAWALLILN